MDFDEHHAFPQWVTSAARFFCGKISRPAFAMLPMGWRLLVLLMQSTPCCRARGKQPQPDMPPQANGENVNPQADVNPEPANDGENMNPQADVGGDSDGGNAADPVVNRKTPTRLIEELLKDRNQRFVGACFQTYKPRPRHIKVMDAVPCGVFKAYFQPIC